jgi:Zn-dependent protease
MNLSNLGYVDLLFKAIAFLFAISIHESAHAWMANRCGDPTARMLGRITLNPIPHIDPIGTLFLPAVGLLTGGAVFGWAKPTPVDPRNFKEPMRDDILISVAGPVSNFLVASCSVGLLMMFALTSRLGHQIVVDRVLDNAATDSSSFLVPATLFFYEVLFINVVLAVFNLIPVPPLDGSHILRHFLPDGVREVYDRAGMWLLIALVVFGGGLISSLIQPVWGFFVQLILRLL